MTDLDLYNREILRLAASIPRIGRLEAPDASVTAHSQLCGSRITVDIELADDVVVDYARTVRACAIGQAVASVVGRVIVGLSVADIHSGAAALRVLLREKRLPTSAPWTALEPFLPVVDVRSRHGSALLPFEAVERALNEIGCRGDDRPCAAVTFDQDTRA